MNDGIAGLAVALGVFSFFGKGIPRFSESFLKAAPSSSVCGMGPGSGQSPLWAQNVAGFLPPFTGWVAPFLYSAAWALGTPSPQTPAEDSSWAEAAH